MTDTAQCGRCGAPVEVGALFCARCGVDVTASQDDDATVAVTTGGSPAAQGPARSTMRQMLREATLGEYEILDELGRGGMATVFRAHDISLDRKVAIKVMAPHLLEGEGMAERFKLEARTAAQLSHPHIIPIYAVKESPAALFFVMKYIEGRPLDEIIQKTGPLPIPMVRDILIKVGSALGYAHRRGVVHRDVKPGNVMIDEEGTPIVTDFGIAKVTESTGLTITGTTIGTPSYMSPEQCEAKQVTGASDQYSLGVVAFHMLTGKVPFEGDSAVTVMYKHCHEELPPLADFRPDCPPELVRAVERMAAKAPADRWPSMEAAVQKLGSATTGETYLDPVRQRLVQAAQEGDLELLARLSTPGGPMSAVGGTDPSGQSPAAHGPARGKRALAVVATVVVLAAVGMLAIVQPWMAGRTAALDDEPATSTAVDAAGSDGAPDVGDVGPTPDGGAPGDDGGGVAEDDAGAGAEAVRPTGVELTADGRTPAGSRTLDDAPAEAETSAASTDASARFVVADVRITGAPDRIEPGSSFDLTATAIDRGGGTIPSATVEACEGLGWTRCGFQWASSDPTVASVSGDGRVTARAPGNVEISVTVDGEVARRLLTVAEASVETVTVRPGSVQLGVGDRAALSAEPRTGSGETVSGRPVSWRSADEGVAGVSQDGMVTGLAPGRTTVTASVGGTTGAVEVIVDVDARTAAVQLIDAYARALEANDLAAARRVYPDLPPEEAEGFARLSELEDLEVTLAVESLDDAGGTASAQLSGTYTFVDRAVGRTVLDVEGNATFARGSEGRWSITRMATRIR